LEVLRCRPAATRGPGGSGFLVVIRTSAAFRLRGGLPLRGPLGISDLAVDEGERPRERGPGRSYERISEFPARHGDLFDTARELLEESHRLGPSRSSAVMILSGSRRELVHHRGERLG